MTTDPAEGNLLVRVERGAVEQCIDDFEEAWQQGQRPAIEDFLSVTGTERGAALIELAHVDLERRLAADLPTRVEDYLQRFPELAPVAVDLIVAEHELRSEREPGLSAAEYLHRFPQYQKDLADRLGFVATVEADTVAGDGTHRDPDVPVAPAAPGELQIPGYAILEELGRGGMGVVYKARQLNIDRLVALKVVSADPEDRTRFRTEAEAVARLQHPHIVQVHEFGEYEGRPFCVMEFVPGGNLQQRLSAGPLPPREAAVLLEPLARAVHAAHSAHVVHRDLKPANILLVSGRVVCGEWSDSTTHHSPLTTHQPKVADFGLAKRLDADSTQTRSGTIIGTPSYMAPEQAAGQGKDVGPAADVYALGAILYECLTGRPPFKAALVLDTLEQVRRQEPVPPSRLQPKVPRDLENICLRCLQKEPRRRYPSALALADDLGRFLDGKPVQARPISAVERLAKWARRQPVVAALLLVVVAVTAAGFGGVVWQWRQTEANLETAEANLYAQRIALADREWLANHPDRAEQLLAECPPARRGWEWHYLSRLNHQEVRTLPAGDSFGVAFGPHGRYVAAASVEKGSVRVWDAASGQDVLTLSHAGPAIAFSPDGRFLASATWTPGPSGEATSDQPCAVKVWEFPGGKEVLNLEGHTGAVFGLSFNSNGSRLASASLDRTVTIWDLKAGQALRTYRGHTSGVEGVAFGADGRLVASIGADGLVRVWDAVNGSERGVFGRAGTPERLKPSIRIGASAGRPILEKSADGSRVLNAASGQPVSSLRAQTHYLFQVAFAPDGKRVAAGQGNVVQLWEIDTGREGPTLRGHTDLVRGLAFDREGRRLASASYDQSVQVWDVVSGEPLATVRGHTGPVNGVAFSPDGRHLASSAWDGTVKLWDLKRVGEAQRLGNHAGPARAIAFDPRDGRVVSAGGDRTIRIWDLAGNVETLASLADPINRLAFHPTESLLASAGDDGKVRVWDMDAKTERLCLSGHTGKVHGVAFSDTLRRLASAGEDGTVRLWNLETGKEEQTFRGQNGPVYAVAFQPRTHRAASAGADRVVRLWDADTGTEVRSFRGHDADVTALATSPDGRFLASASYDRTVKVWEMATGRERFTLKGHTDGITGVTFSPDSRRLITTSIDRGVKVWDAERGQELLSLRGQTAEVLGVSFSGDGRRLAAVAVDGAVLTWDGSEVGR